ncbi:hypothetical protein BD770DRAFT_450188 [Pilaira anomala]|nr:hypothetical protein BD770DRAFT_450188 [Pilaira anomala]
MTQSQENVQSTEPSTGSYQEFMYDSCPDFSFDPMMPEFPILNTPPVITADASDDITKRAFTDMLNNLIPSMVEEALKQKLPKDFGSAGGVRLSTRKALQNEDLEKTRTIIAELYGNKMTVDNLLRDKNSLGRREKNVDKTIKGNNAQLLAACGDTLGISDQEELNRRYSCTYEALEKFVRVQILPGKRSDLTWSDIGRSEQSLYKIMGENFIMTTLGPENGLPLYCCTESWGIRELFVAIIRNCTPRRDKVSKNIAPVIDTSAVTISDDEVTSNGEAAVNVSEWADQPSVFQQRLLNRDRVESCDDESENEDTVGNEGENEVEEEEDEDDECDEDDNEEEIQRLLAKNKADEEKLRKKLEAMKRK